MVFIVVSRLMSNRCAKSQYRLIFWRLVVVGLSKAAMKTVNSFAGSRGFSGVVRKFSMIGEGFEKS